MKNVIAIIIFTFLIFSCGKEKGNMIVEGQIKGLKKGKLYLQKNINGSIRSIDSIELFGNDKFKLSDNVDSPEMYYLTFKNNKENKKIMFFGEKGNIQIYDKIEEFGWKPKVSGSKNHELYEKFKQIDDIYKTKRLDFIAKDIEARAKKDTVETKRLQKEYEKMVKKRFASSIQFALFHKDYEVSPYIALAELFDANFIFVDSINNNLSEKVKKSKYGVELNNYVISVKEKLKK